MTTKNNATGTKVMNKQSVLGKMKVLVLALLATMTLGFASCSSDDDSNGPAQPAAAKVENVQLQLKISESPDMLELVQYTVQWYDAKGDLQEKTLTDKDNEIDLTINYESTATKFGYKITTKTAKKYEEARVYDIAHSYIIQLSARINGEDKTFPASALNGQFGPGDFYFTDQYRFSSFCIRHSLKTTQFYQLTNDGLARMN